MAGPVVSGCERSLRQHARDMALVIGGRVHIAGRLDQAPDRIGDIIHSFGVDALTDEDASGELADAISLPNSASKGKGGGRTIPLHNELRDALASLMAVRGDKLRPHLPIVYSERADATARTPWRSGFTPGLPSLASRVPLRIPVGGLSLPVRHGWLITPAAHCVTFSFWLAIDQFRQHNATSTAIAMRNGSWSR